MYLLTASCQRVDAGRLERIPDPATALDIKFRIYPKVARKLPLCERVANFVHGLYYLQSICVGLQLILLAFMLCTGITPRGFSFFTVARKYNKVMQSITNVCKIAHPQS